MKATLTEKPIKSAKRLSPRQKRWLWFGVPIFIVLLVGLFLFWQYRILSDDAERVAGRLKNIQAIAAKLGDDSTPRNVNSLRQQVQQVQSELDGAKADFQTLQTDLQQRNWLLDLAAITPFSSRVQASRSLAKAAPGFIEAAYTALKVVNWGLDILPQPDKSAANASPGLNLTQPQLDQLKGYLATLNTQLSQGQRELEQLDVSSLGNPELEKSLSQLRRVLVTALPILADSNQYLDSLAQILGLNGTATYLVLIQDTTEGRPTGGFVGNYALINLKQARLDNYLFDNVYNLDDTYLAKNSLVAPEIYWRWWGFSFRWGLRDVNLSPDYPTTAQLAQELATREGATNSPLEAIVTVNTGLIEKLLNYFGPIRVLSPENNIDDMVDSTNLVVKLHTYQLREGQEVGQAFYKRKVFTRLLATELINRVKNLSGGQLLDIVKIVYQSLSARDLLIYFNDPRLQQWLDQQKLAGRVEAATTTATGEARDYWYSVEANTGGNKTSASVDVKAEDLVKFDSGQNARHQLKLTYDYFRAPRPYEEGIYSSYNRQFVPKGATLQSRNGFAQVDAPLEQHERLVIGQSLGVTPASSSITQLGWLVPAQLTFLPNNQAAYNIYVQRQPASNLLYTLKIEPPSGMKVQQLYINDQPASFTANPDGTITLYQAILTHDLNIRVLFAS